MFANLLHELGGRSLGVLAGMLFGSVFTGWVARRRRERERRLVMDGDARDTVVIHQHIVETTQEPDANGTLQTVRVLRIRTLGQSELKRVVPNGHLANILLQRAHKVTPRDTLISMDGPEGSYLLETLTNFVCDRTGNAQFPHDIFVMTACCEPAEFSHHQPVTILLVRREDLPLFENWTTVRNLHVEHGSDGPRILTLMEMANRFRQEQQKITELRSAGRRSAFVETMYILDLPIDQKCAPLATKPVPWGRFENILKELNLDAA